MPVSVVPAVVTTPSTVLGTLMAFASTLARAVDVKCGTVTVDLPLWTLRDPSKFWSTPSASAVPVAFVEINVTLSVGL